MKPEPVPMIFAAMGGKSTTLNRKVNVPKLNTNALALTKKISTNSSRLGRFDRNAVLRESS
jgi:hypothetical protein